jgi:Putative MetA-pathway of phenol degradation
MTDRIRVSVLVMTFAVSLAAVPAWASTGCVTARQERQSPPLADARTYQPVNGTGGFSVFGANTLAARGFSVGLGFLGEDAVCQELDGDFDFNTLWLALAYGITDRLQIGVDIPYSWFEADKAQFDGSGLEDINFGVVYRLLDEGTLSPALALVGFAAAPTAKRSEGLGRNAWDAGAKVALSKTLPGGLLGHMAIGYTYAGRGGTSQDNQFTSGVALEYPIGPHFALVSEALADTNRRTGTDRSSDWVAEMRAGFRVRWGGFLLSVAGRKGLTNDAPDWGVFALLTYTHTPAKAAAVAPPPAAVPGPPAAVPAPAGFTVWPATFAARREAPKLRRRPALPLHRGLRPAPAPLPLRGPPACPRRSLRSRPPRCQRRSDPPSGMPTSSSTATISPRTPSGPSRTWHRHSRPTQATTSRSRVTPTSAAPPSTTSRWASDAPRR